MTWPIVISDVAESCMTTVEQVRNPPYAEHGTKVRAENFRVTGP